MQDNGGSSNGNVTNGNKVVEMVHKQLGDLQTTVNDGFREMREARAAEARVISDLDKRVALADLAIQRLPCATHKRDFDIISKEVTTLRDEVKHKMSWRTMTVAIVVGVMSVVVSKWGGVLIP